MLKKILIMILAVSYVFPSLAQAQSSQSEKLPLSAVQKRARAAALSINMNEIDWEKLFDIGLFVLGAGTAYKKISTELATQRWAVASPQAINAIKREYDAKQMETLRQEILTLLPKTEAEGVLQMSKRMLFQYSPSETTTFRNSYVHNKVSQTPQAPVNSLVSSKVLQRSKIPQLFPRTFLKRAGLLTVIGLILSSETANAPTTAEKTLFKRLMKNPNLFVQATGEELKTIEQYSLAESFCRTYTEFLEQLSSLPTETQKTLVSMVSKQSSVAQSRSRRALNQSLRSIKAR